MIYPSAARTREPAVRTRFARPGVARLTWGFLACALLAAPAAALVIDSGDGTGNTSAPADDPGWGHVGAMSGLSVVYVRNGWVLTANHVATDVVSFGGQSHYPVDGSETRVDDGAGGWVDLKVVGLYPDPGFPELAIRSNSKLPNGKVILIGRGRSRGAASDSDDPTCWSPPPDPPAQPIDGYRWNFVREKRWGENRVDGYWPGNPGNTKALVTVFSDPSDPGYEMHEAQATDGDSGGALFAKQGPDWQLAGLIYAIGHEEGQSFACSLYGNITGAADLPTYRDSILALTADPVPLPEPGFGLGMGCGILLLAVLGSVRRSRGTPSENG